MRYVVRDRGGHPAAVDRWAARGAAARLWRGRQCDAVRRPGILPQPAVALGRCPVLRYSAPRAGPAGGRGVGRIPSRVRAGGLDDRRSTEERRVGEKGRSRRETGYLKNKYMT